MCASQTDDRPGGIDDTRVYHFTPFTRLRISAQVRRTQHKALWKCFGYVFREPFVRISNSDTDSSSCSTRDSRTARAKGRRASESWSCLGQTVHRIEARRVEPSSSRSPCRAAAAAAAVAIAVAVAVAVVVAVDVGSDVDATDAVLITFSWGDARSCLVSEPQRLDLAMPCYWLGRWGELRRRPVRVCACLCAVNQPTVGNTHLAQSRPA